MLFSPRDPDLRSARRRVPSLTGMIAAVAQRATRPLKPGITKSTPGAPYLRRYDQILAAELQQPIYKVCVGFKDPITRTCNPGSECARRPASQDVHVVREC